MCSYGGHSNRFLDLHLPSFSVCFFFFCFSLLIYLLSLYCRLRILIHQLKVAYFVILKLFEELWILEVFLTQSFSGFTVLVWQGRIGTNVAVNMAHAHLWYKCYCVKFSLFWKYLTKFQINYFFFKLKMLYFSIIFRFYKFSIFKNLS